MKKIKLFMSERVMPSFAKMATQRHLLAIRNGIVQCLPFIIAGSIPLIINSFPIGQGQNDVLSSVMPADVRNWMYWGYKWCFTSLALIAGIAVGAELAKLYRLNPTIGATLGGVSLLLWILPVYTYQGLDENNQVIEQSIKAIKISSIDSSAMLGAIVGALFSVEIYRFVVKHNITIKLPKEVPTAVSQAFIAVIPGIIIVIGYTAIRHLVGFQLSSFLSVTLEPIGGFIKSTMAGAILINFLIEFFWWFGINLSGMINGMVRPFWLQGLEENQNIKDGTIDGHYNTYVEQFNQSFTQAGGSGNTLGLILVIFLFGKSKDARITAKVSIIPGLFNINEPLIFGLPIMINPYLLIPFLIAPIVNVVVGGLFVDWFNIHLIAAAPWTLPTPIFALMASGFQWQAIILALITIGCSMLVYFPFMKFNDKALLAAEKIRKEQEENKQQKRQALLKNKATN